MSKISANELRIGNWIADRGGKQWQINHWETSNKVASKAEKYMVGNIPTSTHPLTEEVDYLQPILLTEEWLKSFGFEIKYELPSGFKCIFADFEHRTEDFRVYLPIKGESHGEQCSVNIRAQESHYPLIFRFDYVHQFQNIYFLLTGKELEIKP